MVIGIFFDTDPKYKAYPAKDYMKMWKWNELGEKKIDIANMYLLNEIDYNGFYHYEGSLTTPPCSPVVRWYVYKEVLYITPDELSYMQHALQPQSDLG